MPFLSYKRFLISPLGQKYSSQAFIVIPILIRGWQCWWWTCYRLSLFPFFK